MTNDDYPTDEWLKAVFEDYFDPCTLSTGELREFDGLGSSWGAKTFVNPPYSDPMPWVKQAIEENKKGKTVVLLLKMDTSTKWFAALQEAGAHILWINGRMKHRTGKPATFPSMLAILSKKGIDVSEGK